jgi:hypothetical protein
MDIEIDLLWIWRGAVLFSLWMIMWELKKRQ